MTEAELLEEARRELREVFQALPVTTVAFTGDYGMYVRACVETLLEQERAAVVVWLRTQRLYCTDSTGTPNAVSATYAHAAEAIEDGEHRREEEPARAGGFGVRLATLDELVEMGLLERPVKEER